MRGMLLVELEVVVVKGKEQKCKVIDKHVLHVEDKVNKKSYTDMVAT